MKSKLLFYIYFLTTFLSFSQIQIGGDIDAELANDWLGTSISLSADGNIVAIGAPSNDGNGNVSGHTRIYQNINGTWTQIGNDIDGEASGDESGTSVSLSSNGSVVAIGAYLNDGNGNLWGHVRIYENNNGAWVQVGNDIDGETSGDRSGFSVSLSADGNTVAISARFNGGNGVNSGHVRVYQNLSGVWTQIGSDIDGEAVNDYSGYSLSLSENGNTLAVGTPTNDGNGSDSGHVRVYQNISGAWIQVGNDLDGEASGDWFGSSVSLSADGNILAIGAIRNDGNGSNSGHVRIYRNVSGSWVQIGSDIDGEASNDWLGFSVSLSDNGNILAIGAPFNADNGSNSGHVLIYQNVNDVWVKIGSNINGEAGGDQLGISVSLSANGNILAIGAPFNDGNGANSGHVRVYELSTIVLSNDSFSQDYFSVYVNNKTKVIEINLKDTHKLKKVNLYTLDGKYLYSGKTLSLSTTGLYTGIYILEIEMSSGEKSTKK